LLSSVSLLQNKRLITSLTFDRLPRCRQQSARLSREGRMIGDLALYAKRLRFNE
jgi:hypothetical protein